MKRLRPTTSYKKDFKKIRNNPDKVRGLYEFLSILMNELEIPAKYRAHRLTGDYQGILECHIQGDLLLLWIDAESNIIELMRLGSHSDIFGKGPKR